MYDMTLPGDEIEIAAIRERLHCDQDTAILTIFDRRNRLISTCLRGCSSNSSNDFIRSCSAIAADSGAAAAIAGRSVAGGSRVRAWIYFS